MSQPSRGVPPFRVAYSGRFRESLRQQLGRAAALGRFAELAQVVRDLHSRVEHIGVVPPLVLTYAVDEARRIVHVSVPFKLLPNSGLQASRALKTCRFRAAPGAEVVASTFDETWPRSLWRKPSGWWRTAGTWSSCSTRSRDRACPQYRSAVGRPLKTEH